MSNLTRKRMRRYVIVAVLTIAGLLLVHGNAAAQQEQEESAYNVMSEGHHVHILPTLSKATELAGVGMAPTPLTYHGGPVMTKANTYAIFWAPAKLQTGAPTGLSTHYQNVQTALLSLYPGHGIDNNNTQYYMTSGGLFRFTSYVQNAGGFVASYVDTSPYPASGCTDEATPGNCLSDAQIQAEIKKVITLKRWPVGGINNMFLLYTSSGEGSCAGAACAYIGFPGYCAYHSYFLIGSSPVIYGNEPFADLCQVPGTPSPNRDPVADMAANITSHELTEAITDPELNAWYDESLGGEIGDKCVGNYGANTWDSGNANQSWWESFRPIIFLQQIGSFELQQEYDNHAGSCVQLGP